MGCVLSPYTRHEPVWAADYIELTTVLKVPNKNHLTLPDLGSETNDCEILR